MSRERLWEMDKHIVSTIWTSEEAYQNLLFLCDDLGHRFAGSPQEHRAASFLKEKMEAYGFDRVWLEEFPMASWERGDCHLELTEPMRRNFPVIAMPYCPSAELEAEVIDVGEGELPDFERLVAEIVGKIVLTDAETNKPGERKSHRMDKYNWAKARGALACVFMNQNPGMLRITGRITGRNPNMLGAHNWEAAIPGLGISYEAGKTIRRLAERGPLRMKISTSNRTFDSVSYNVIGEIAGSAQPNEVILIGGHYDSHDIAQGAGDDGAGTVVGLEAGRALAGFKGRVKRTIRVICFGSEEVGLRGAWHHAATQAADDSGKQLRFVLNLDGSGQGNGDQEQVNVSGIPELVGYFRDLSKYMLSRFDVTNDLTSRSDHFPFAIRGVPNATLSSTDRYAGMVGRGWDHTEADTLDKISLRGLQSSAILAARLALRVSEDEAFPGRRRSVDDVRQQLAAAGILSQVEHAGRFPPEHNRV